jgi:hypothetical protein
MRICIYLRNDGIVDVEDVKPTVGFYRIKVFDQYIRDTTDVQIIPRTHFEIKVQDLQGNFRSKLLDRLSIGINNILVTLISKFTV